MSRACAAGSYLAVDTAIITDEPLTIGCLFKRVGTANTQTLLMLGEKDHASGGNSYQLAVNSSDNLIGRTESAGSGASTATAGMSVGNDVTNWHFAAFRTSGNASRYAQLDTTLTAEQTNSIAVTNANVNCLRIGLSTGSGGIEPLEALIAHVWGYNAALSDGDLLLLAGGANPLAISASNLKFYFPFTDSGDIADKSGSGLVLTDNGTSFNADNPTVDAPPSGGGSLSARRSGIPGARIGGQTFGRGW